MIRLASRFLKAFASAFGLWHAFLFIERYVGWRRQVIVLVYHHVSTNEEFPQALSGLQGGTPVEVLSVQMRTLCRWYKPVSMDQLESMVQASEVPREDLFVVTFDDAYSSVGNRSGELLRSMGIHGHVFVATDYVGTGRRFWWVRWVDWLHRATPVDWEQAARISGLPTGILQAFRLHRIDTWQERRQASKAMLAHLDAWTETPRDVFLDQLEALSPAVGPSVLPVASWHELREWVRNGFTLGAHSHTHPRFSRLSEDEAIAEFSTSNSMLERETGVIPRTLAWPSGDFDEDACRLARQCGYSLAFSTRHGFFGGAIPDAMQFPRTSLGNRQGSELAARLALIKFQKYFAIRRRKIRKISEFGPGQEVEIQ